ncbi:mitochondrial amidoxime reducing component 2 [Anabrus simplex]|uniref:mitochondrial amidoxime reducing component 2 n=1 Tax=Anabrus simplex TaxID=316456 RepID=UPI0035A2D549
MPDQVKTLTIAVGAAALVGVYVVHWWWKRRLPTKWRKVGELADIMCFPIKSCAVIKLQSVQCETLGPRDGFLRDRTFMIVNQMYNFITARQQPEMIKITPKIEGDKLTLTAPGMEQSVMINITSLLTHPKRKAKVWRQIVEVIDCGDEVAEWLARYMSNGPHIKPRLVYYPRQEATRDVLPEYKVFKYLHRKDVGALPDASSYNMIVQESVDDLNTRLTEPVTPLTFRPNFVIRGPKAFDEDTWDYVRIGDVIFRNVMPCTRCILTTVNPETGVKDHTMEPVKTLKTYRQITDAKLKRWVGESPCMGLHLVLCTGGSVKVGDEVYVGVN